MERHYSSLGSNAELSRCSTEESRYNGAGGEGRSVLPEEGQYDPSIYELHAYPSPYYADGLPVHDRMGSTTNASLQLTLPRVDDPSEIHLPLIPTPITNDDRYISGHKRLLTQLGLFIGLALVSADTTLITAAIDPIIREFGHPVTSNWVISGYLLSFAGFNTLLIAISGAIGRKPVLLFSFITFVAFSLASALAQSMIQLVIFRVLQGVGASGIYAINTIISLEVVARGKLPAYAATFMFVSVVSLGLGTAIGGLIVTNTTWRWTFWLNIPLGTVALLCVAYAMPGLPFYLTGAKPSFRTRWQNLASIDWIGYILLNSAITLLITSLLIYLGSSLSFMSTPVIVPLIICLVSFGAFIVYEMTLCSRQSRRDGDSVQQLLHIRRPLYNWRLLKDKNFSICILYGFLTGFPFFAIVILLPQYFVIVEKASLVQAAAQTIPIFLGIPLCTIPLGLLMMTCEIPLIPCLATISAILALALGMLASTFKHNLDKFGATEYILLVILGIGFGPSLEYCMVFCSLQVRAKAGSTEDLIITMALIAQLRNLAGALSVSVAGAVMKQSIEAAIRGHSLKTLSPEDAGLISSTPTQLIETLPEPGQSEARQFYRDSFKSELIFVSILAGVSAVMILGAWEKNWTRMRKMDISLKVKNL